MFRSAPPLMGAIDPLHVLTEPNYVLVLTLFNAVVVAYVVTIHLRKVRREQTREKPGTPPQ